MKCLLPAPTQQFPLSPHGAPSPYREEPMCKFTRKAALAEVLEAPWSGQAFMGG